MRTAGVMMIASAVAVVAAMGHHPSSAHGGGLAGSVHGLMIALLLVLTWGFLTFAKGRGESRPLIVAGLIAYAVSVFAHVGAATINGFVVPALASPQTPPVSHDIFRLAWESNQALAKLGVYLTSAAYLLWSLELLRERSSGARITGLLGLVAGAVPMVLLAAGLVRMDVAGAFLIYAVHVAWAALVGAMMWRGAFDNRAAVEGAV